jgi:hypothetical protein
MAEGNDKSAKIRTPQLATAALLVKAGLYAQYKTQITVGNKYETKTKGRVVVAYAGPKPADTDLKVIQDRVNKLILDSIPVEVTEQDRKTAEAHYTKNPVNGQFIYEKKEPPASATSLTIVTIPDVTVSVSASKDFVTTTKEVGGIEILRFNHREAKQELEVCFQLTDGVPSASSSSDTKNTASNTSQSAPAVPALKVHAVADAYSALFDAFVDSLAKTRPDIQLSSSDLDNLKSQASRKSNVILTALKNNSYASGFSAHI